jgi:hypothetical protein
LVCGLSTSRGPVLIGREAYFKQIANNPANVDAIIGSALKLELQRTDPKGEWVSDEFKAEADVTADEWWHPGAVAELTFWRMSSEQAAQAAFAEAKPLTYVATGRLFVTPVFMSTDDGWSTVVYENDQLAGYLGDLESAGYPPACPVTHVVLTGSERVLAALDVDTAVAAYVQKYGQMQGPAWAKVRGLCDAYTAEKAAKAQ